MTIGTPYRLSSPALTASLSRSPSVTAAPSGQAGLALDNHLAHRPRRPTGSRVRRAVADSPIFDLVPARPCCPSPTKTAVSSAFANDRGSRERRPRHSMLLGIDVHLYRRAGREIRRRVRRPRRTGIVAVPGSTAEGRETTFSATSGCRPADGQRARALPISRTTRVTSVKRNRRDDFEPLGIDDAEHHCDRRQRLPRHRPGCDSASRRGRRTSRARRERVATVCRRRHGLPPPARRRPAASAICRCGVLHFLPRAATPRVKRIRARRVSLAGGVGERGLRTLHFSRLLCDFGSRTTESRSVPARHRASTRSPSPR